MQILVMEDEKDLLVLFEMILLELEHTVLIAKNGEETLKISKEEDVDVFFIDLTIASGMQGEETIKLLLQENPNYNIVIATGGEIPGYLLNIPFIRKPFLLSTIEALLQEIGDKK